MRYNRTYFDKDNVIVKNSTINEGANPIVKLFYGGTNTLPIYSRYLFHFNESYLKDIFDNCGLGDLQNVTHTLKLKPTLFFGDNVERCFASQYTLCLFKIEQEWVEGCGSSFGCEDECNIIQKKYCDPSHSPSNWYNATPTTLWEEEGVFDNITGDTVYLQCVNVGCDVDCDYISFDLTHEVNDMLTGDTVNFGYGIALNSNFELFPAEQTKYIGFYGRETSTFYEPFLETVNDIKIEDSRADFINGNMNKLYLTVKKNGTRVNLDNFPVVTIINDSDEVVFQTSGYCVDMGVYCADVILTGDTVDCSGMYTDRWEMLSVGGVDIGYIDQEFEVKPLSQMFDFGNNIGEDIKYGFRFRGINRGEKIKSGDIRRLYVDGYREFDPKKKVSLDSVMYRIYKKEGCNEHDIIGWCFMDKLNCDHFIDIDTSWMIKGEYFIDFKAVLNGIERTYNEEVYFDILNEKCC
jgi:hypothetical protein